MSSNDAGPQPGDGGGPRDRGGRDRRLAPRRPRRREGRRPGRGRRHAHGAQRAGHRRRDRDRRGRARRGADALHRREGRHGHGPAHRHRARSARRHHADRQGDGQRAGGDGLGAGRHACSTRRTPTWTRSPAGRAIRRASSTSTRAPPTTPRRWPRPRASTPPQITVCVLDRPRHAEIIASLREAGARVHLITDGDVAGRDQHRRSGHRRRPLRRPGRRAGGRAGLRGAEVRRRPVPGPAGVPQRRRARAAPSGWASRTSTRSTTCTRSSAPTPSSPPPASPRARCWTACASSGGFVHTHSLVMNSSTRTVREVRMKRAL